VTFNGAMSPQMSLALDAFRNNGLLPFSEEHARETLAIYASLRRTAWEAAMEVLYETCCGLDVHKSSITACVLLEQGHKPQKQASEIWLYNSGPT
jgi:hypothetical protein